MSCDQVQILLWKCWIRRKRDLLSTLVQLVLPLLMCLLVTYSWSRQRSRQEPRPTGLPQLPTDQNQNGPPIVNGSRGPFYFDTSNSSFIPGHYCQGQYSTLYFTPNSSFTRNITDDIVGRVCRNLNPSHVAVATGQELDRILAERAEQSDRWVRAAGIYFDVSDGETIPKQLRYTIRAFEGDDGYRQFVWIQMAINEAYLNLLAPRSSNPNDSLIRNYSVYEKRFPYPRRPAEEVVDNPGFSLMTLVLVTGNTFIVIQIVKQIADESSSKIKELLRMMGMSDWVFWFSHFVDFFILMFLQTVVITYLTVVAYGNNSLLFYSDASLVFIVLILFNIQTILFCQAISTMFNKPVVGSMAAAIIWLATFEVLNLLLFPESQFNSEKNNLAILSCFLPQMAIKWFFNTFANQYEAAEKGLKWSNLFSTNILFGNFTPGIVILMVLLSYVFYIIFIWYVDAVWPWQMGVPKPWYFPFTKDYWSPKWEHVEERSKIKSEKNIEEPPADCPVNISAKNLSKKFNSNYAVKNLYLDIYHGNINVLLGHNGAGKTTAMNMMTGIFPPTSGTVIVDGYDIRKQTKQARLSMGMCTQDNVYYEDLTVNEHLIIFAALKGCPENKIQDNVDSILKKLKIFDKKNEFAKSLSGGMKRRLMLAIAMVNDTKILVLDEPTSGLDPESRRIVWDVLLETRAQRTILLSTHYMEEAEVLGDRISIMSSGQLVCSGTAMFLKKKFSTGYRLRIAKQENFEHKKVNEIITKHVPSAKIQSEIPTEIVYLLTAAENEDESKIRSRFPDLFDELEQNKSQLGIDSYGVSVNTIEEVFLKVGELAHEHEQKKDEANKDAIVEFKPELFEQRVTGVALTMNRFIALFKKRFLIAKRHWKMMLTQMVIPCWVLIFALQVNFIGESNPSNNETIQYDISLYGPTEGFFRDYTGRYQDLGLAYQRVARRRQVTVHFINQSALQWTLQRAENDLRNYVTKHLIGLEVENERDGNRSQNVLHVWFNPGTWRLNINYLPTLALSINTLYEAMANYRRPENDPITIMASNKPITRSSRGRRQ